MYFLPRIRLENITNRKIAQEQRMKKHSRALVLLLTSYCAFAINARAQVTVAQSGWASALVGETRELVLSGNFAFVANGSDGLRVFNIATPISPVPVVHTNNGGSAFGVALA